MIFKKTKEEKEMERREKAFQRELDKLGTINTELGSASKKLESIVKELMNGPKPKQPNN